MEMKTAEASHHIGKLERVLIGGDLATLSEAERLSYYKNVCEGMGLNPLTQPFAFITLNGKLTMYAKRECTEQLRKIHNVSLKIPSREVLGDVYVVTAQASLPGGRCDESTGAVTITGLKGDNLANAYLKAETKAKRRVTLSICGLGMLDETEVDSIPGASTNPAQHHITAGFGPIKPQAPGPNDGIQNSVYRIGFGKYNGRSLEEVGVENLMAYVNYLEESSSKPGAKPLSGKALEFISHAEKFIGAFENDAVTAMAQANHEMEDQGPKAIFGDDEGPTRIGSAADIIKRIGR